MTETFTEVASGKALTAIVTDMSSPNTPLLTKTSSSNAETKVNLLIPSAISEAFEHKG